MKRKSIWILAAALVLLVMGCDDEPTYQVDGISLSPTECRIAPDEKVSFWVQTWPDIVDYTEITWSSSNEAVATIDEYGWVVAVSEGKATITAELYGKSATCEVTVCAHSWSDLKCTKCGIKMYIEDGVINDKGVLTNYTGIAAEVVIPEGVTGIGSCAFFGCTSLKSVTIPDSVKSIGMQAFWDCTELTSATIGKGVTSIGYGAFLRCTSLKNVTIPDSVTSIGESAFSGCMSLTSVTIPAGVTSIVERTFSECRSLTSVTIPASVTEIKYDAFYMCSNLKTVNYGGTQQEWENINISKNYPNSNTDGLFCATITGKDGTTWKVK